MGIDFSVPWAEHEMEATVEALQVRVAAAREQLRAAPLSTSPELGPPDPQTGERWDRLNVLGHTAEMLPYWSNQLAATMASGAPFGRAPGSAQRVEGIESGRLIGEPQLRVRIEAGTEVLLAFLASLKEGDLDREVVHIALGPMPLNVVLERYLVGHFEEHCKQLAELGQEWPRQG